MGIPGTTSGNRPCCAPRSCWSETGGRLPNSGNLLDRSDWTDIDWNPESRRPPILPDMCNEHDAPPPPKGKDIETTFLPRLQRLETLSVRDIRGYHPEKEREHSNHSEHKPFKTL